jgi:hypothetical protein
MIITNKHVEQYLDQTRIILERVKEDTAVKELIVTYGYTDERLDEGIALYSQVDSLYHELITRRGEQAKLSFSVQEKFENLAARFSALSVVFKTVFFDNPELLKELGLIGRTKRSLPAFITQVTSVYTNARDKQHILDQIAGFDLTTEKLQAELDEVDELHRLHKEHVGLRGECQNLVEERDKKLAQLKRFMRQLKTILLMLYKESPQTLERLGIFVRNRRKSPAKTEPPDTNTEPDPQTDPQATPQS